MRPFPKELPAPQMKSLGHIRQHLEILVSKPGIKPMLPAVKAQTLNHWKTRDVLKKNSRVF